MRTKSMIVAAGLMLASCGYATAATRAFPVGAFDRITNATPLDVQVHTGGAPAVHAEAPPELLDRLEIGTQGGLLTIGMKRGSWPTGWRSHGQRTLVTVSVPALQGARVDGPGDMIVDHVRAQHFAATLDGPGNLTIGSVEARQVEASVNGPGDLRIAGRAESATLSVRGPGNLAARDLTVRNATVDASGPGDLSVTATGTAQGALSGPGNVIVSGGAHCIIAKHGPGDLHCG